MYSINYTHQFKKDMRKCAKRGLDIEEIKTAIKILSETGALPAEYKPHLLKGDRKGQRLSGDRSLACTTPYTSYHNGIISILSLYIVSNDFLNIHFISCLRLKGIHKYSYK